MGWMTDEFMELLEDEGASFTFRNVFGSGSFTLLLRI